MDTINPEITMSLTDNFPLAKTIAFGGVATGRIKANEQAIVVGSISANGLT
jgi:hypothetical protein